MTTHLPENMTTSLPTTTPERGRTARRHFLRAAAATSTAGILAVGLGHQPAQATVTDTQVLYASDHGMVGDGTTNDYPGLKQISDAVMASPGGRFVVVFEPNKNYYLDHSYATPSQWASHDLVFSNTTSITLHLNGSTITTKRGLQLPKASGLAYSTTIPAVFRFANNGRVAIINGTIDGSNDTAALTDGAAYVVAGSSAMMIGGNERVDLVGLTVRRAICDGILLRYEPGTGESVANKVVRMTDCTFVDAGRNGVSFTGNADVVATRCRFSGSGTTFTGSSPLAGIDIEDEWFYGPSDIAAYRYRFVDCEFVDNVGGDIWSATRFTGGDPTTGILDRDIRFTGCRFDYTQHGQRLAGDCGVVLSDCTLTNVSLTPFYGVATSTYPTTQRTRWMLRISDCTWQNTIANRRWILQSGAAPAYTLRGNTFSHTAVSTASYWALWLQLSDPTTAGWQESVVAENTFTVADSCAGSLDLAVRGQYATFRNNHWSSPLPAATVKLNMAGATIDDTLDPAFVVV